MLMPMVVYWRTDLPGVRRHRRWTLAATTIALLLALFLSFPKNLHVVTEPRVIGGAIEERIGGYERMEAGLWGRVNQDFHFGPSTVKVYPRAAPNTTSFRAEPCT